MMLPADEHLPPDAISEVQVRTWLAQVPDPEIPVLSVTDLGIVRGVTVNGISVEVEVAPTYSGCPATEVIEQSILAALRDRGLKVSLRRVLSPPVDDGLDYGSGSTKNCWSTVSLRHWQAQASVKCWVKCATLRARDARHPTPLW